MLVAELEGRLGVFHSFYLKVSVVEAELEGRLGLFCSSLPESLCDGGRRKVSSVLQFPT